jgi:hypothetical protein
MLKSLVYTSQKSQGVFSRKKGVFNAVYGNGQYLDNLFCSYETRKCTVLAKADLRKLMEVVQTVS